MGGYAECLLPISLTVAYKQHDPAHVKKITVDPGTTQRLRVTTPTPSKICITYDSPKF